MMHQPVRGTHDFLPDKMSHYKALLALADSTLGRFGFREMATPLMESADVFTHVGETSDIVTKETYTFPDRGGDMLTLRPEGTAPVIRAVMSNGLTQSLPLKYYYAGAMFRYDRPQKGRFRQFHQLGLEYIGLPGSEADAEVIAAADMFLKALAIRDQCTLHLNTLGDTPSRLAFTEALVTYFSKYKNDLSEDSRVRLGKNPLRILDSKDPRDRKLFDEAPGYEGYLSENSRSHYNRVRHYLDQLGIDYTHNPQIVRGLDYYAHTTFEYILNEGGAQGTVLAGGRYDGLCESMGGQHLPGVGWAAGLERLMLLHAYKDTVPRALGLGVMGNEALDKGMMLANTLRAGGMNVHFLNGNNPGKLLKKLDKFAVTHALIVGTDELSSGRGMLKHMASGDQIAVALDMLSCDTLAGMEK